MNERNKQTNLNQFLFRKNGNAVFMTKKIVQKNIRDLLDNLNKQQNKKLKLAIDSCVNKPFLSVIAILSRVKSNFVALELNCNLFTN